MKSCCPCTNIDRKSRFQSPIALPTFGDSKTCLYKSTAQIVLSQKVIRPKRSSEHIGYNILNTVNIEANCENYTLQNYHIHSPAEHIIEIKSTHKTHDAEIHFVHADLEGNILVLSMFLCAINGRGDQNIESALLGQPFILPKLNRYWTLPGSLTAPPFSKTIHWLIKFSPLDINRSILVELERAQLIRTARPIELRKGRDIILCQKRSIHPKSSTLNLSLRKTTK